jgi:hypothetical protein
MPVLGFQLEAALISLPVLLASLFVLQLSHLICGVLSSLTIIEYRWQIFKFIVSYWFSFVAEKGICVPIVMMVSIAESFIQ